MSTAEQQRWVSWGFPSNLLCIFFPKTQTMPASSQQHLQHPRGRTFSIQPAGPSRSLRHPQKARLGWQPLMPRQAQSYQPRAGQLAGAPSRHLSIPLVGPPSSLARPSSAADFPQAPHNVMQAVQPEGTTMSSDLCCGPELQYYSVFGSTG